jgi:hypothetical protein
MKQEVVQSTCNNKSRTGDGRILICELMVRTRTVVRFGVISPKRSQALTVSSSHNVESRCTMLLRPFLISKLQVADHVPQHTQSGARPDQNKTYCKKEEVAKSRDQARVVMRSLIIQGTKACKKTENDKR